MIKAITTILLIVHMVLGLFVWLENHDNMRLRVIRLGSVVLIAVILLFVLHLSDT